MQAHLSSEITQPPTTFLSQQSNNSPLVYSSPQSPQPLQPSRAVHNPQQTPQHPSTTLDIRQQPLWRVVESRGSLDAGDDASNCGRMGHKITFTASGTLKIGHFRSSGRNLIADLGPGGPKRPLSKAWSPVHSVGQGQPSWTFFEKSQCASR